LLDQLAYAMGGRVAEEIVFHDPTTGAANDIEKATGIARKMVTQYGMSDRVGMVKVGEGSSEPMGRPGGGGAEQTFSDTTLQTIDAEARALVDDAHADAYWARNENRELRAAHAHAPLANGTLHEAQLAEISAPVVKRDPRTVWLASRDRPVSSRPPIEVPVSRRTAAAAAAAEAQADEARAAEAQTPGAQAGEAHGAQADEA